MEKRYPKFQEGNFVINGGAWGKVLWVIDCDDHYKYKVLKFAGKTAKWKESEMMTFADAVEKAEEKYARH